MQPVLVCFLKPLDACVRGALLNLWGWSQCSKTLYSVCILSLCVGLQGLY